MDITQDPKFQYFLSQREIKENTKNKYIRDMTWYCEFTGMTPSELVNQARREQKDFEYEDERQINTHLSRFKGYLQKKEYSPYSVKHILLVVKIFYHQFNINTPNITVKKAVPSTFYLTLDDLPSHDDLRLFISNAILKYKAMFMILASSGMNISDVINLTITHLLNAVKYHYPDLNSLQDLYKIIEKEEGIIPVWKLPRTKTDEPRVTFSSPESLKFTIDYLKSNPPQDNKDPLFRSNRGNIPVTYTAVARYTQRLNKKIGWENRKIGYFNYITTKSFRTYFANTLESYGVQEKFIRTMMGHKQMGIRQFYHKLNIALLLKEYSQALPGLVFIEQIQVVDTSEEQMKEFKQEMEDRLNELEAKLLKEYADEVKKLPRPDKN